MPHSIEVPDRVFERLQAIATPFVDTPISVIEHLLDRHEKALRSLTRSDQAQEGGLTIDAQSFAPGKPPRLTHTRLIKAVFDKEELARPKWNELVRRAHEIAYERLGDFESLRQVSVANLVKGEKQDEGFRPLNELGFSLQGVDANDAWQIGYGLAKKLAVPIEVWFEWREKEGAEHPGVTGVLAWSPQQPD